MKKTITKKLLAGGICKKGYNRQSSINLLLSQLENFKIVKLMGLFIISHKTTMINFQTQLRVL